ncbi:MAG: flavodoxin family protein [Firmicutes bacterium]|nr:flavodoxin family protein [Bacillota bacterium]
MRVCGFVYSPRREANSELAVKEIMKQLPDDWEKVMVRLNDLDIKPCQACYHCVPRGSHCAISDDLDVIIRNVKHSDRIIIAFPTYIFTAPGPVKMIMDRLLSVTSDYPDWPHPYPSCVVVTPYGMAEWEGMVKEDAIAFANKLHLNVLAVQPMLATLPADSVRGDNLETLHRLAKLLEKGKKSDQPSADFLECPSCTSTALKVRPDGTIKCAVCAATGTLKRMGKGFIIEQGDGDSAGYFTERALDNHTQYLSDKKILFRNTKDIIKEIQSNYKEPEYWWKDDGEGHHHE